MGENTMIYEILPKLNELIEKISKIENMLCSEWVKISTVAKEAGVKVQSVHYQLGHNIDIEPEVDFKMRGGVYYIRRSAAEKLKKVFAKNG